MYTYIGYDAHSFNYEPLNNSGKERESVALNKIVTLRVAMRTRDRVCVIKKCKVSSFQGVLIRENPL